MSALTPDPAQVRVSLQDLDLHSPAQVVAWCDGVILDRFAAECGDGKS